MVFRCVVCKVYNHQNHNLSFHRFPTNLKRKIHWMKILNLFNTKIGPRSVICSQHFSLDSYNHDAFGPNKYLRKDAVPLAPDTYATNTVPPDASKPVTSKISHEIGEPKSSTSSSSTASTSVVPSPMPVKRQLTQEIRSLKRKVHIDDIQSNDDLASVSKVTILYNLAKKRSLSSLKQIKNLRENIGCLRKQVKNMEILLEHLKSKSQISHSLESTVKES